MKKLFTATAILSTALITSTASFADGHGGTEIVIPANMCQETIDVLAKWAIGKKPYSAFAVPTGKPRECGEPGPAVTAGIALSAPSAREAQAAALRVCNENRGNFGRCVVIGTVRPKS